MNNEMIILPILYLESQNLATYFYALNYLRISSRFLAKKLTFTEKILLPCRLVSVIDQNVLYVTIFFRVKSANMCTDLGNDSHTD